MYTKKKLIFNKDKQYKNTKKKIYLNHNFKRNNKYNCFKKALNKKEI